MLADALLVWTAIAASAVVATLIWWIIWSLVQRRGTRVQRADDKAAADARSRRQEAAAAEAALVGKQWHFTFRLRAAVGDAAPAEPPVEISVTGGVNVWVHEVRLSWKPLRNGITPWSVHDGLCVPWNDDVSIPFLLKTSGHPLRLAWPGPNPSEQGPIETKIKVTYSASPEGPRREAPADGGSMGWQDP